MPYVTSWPHDSFLAVFEGIVTVEEIEAVNNAFSDDARMETVRYAIWDFSAAAAVDIPVSEIENAAAFDRATAAVRPTLRGALIASDPGVRAKIEAYLRIAGEMDVGWDTRLFETLTAARHWLEHGD